MALLTCQLLFVELIDERTVQLDLIVLDRVEAASSPPLGAPLAFAFRLPGEPGSDDSAATLEGWAEHAVTVDLTLLEWGGARSVVVTNGTRAVTLQQANPVA